MFIINLFLSFKSTGFLLYLMYNKQRTIFGVYILVIYADILVILNVIVDYFLISVTGKILKFKEKVIKYLVASLIGGLSSFYIFLPVNFFVIDIFFKILVCFLMSFSAWKYINFKTLLKSSIVLFGITLLYGGIMFFIYKTFTPKSMAGIIRRSKGL